MRPFHTAFFGLLSLGVAVGLFECSSSSNAPPGGTGAGGGGAGVGGGGGVGTGGGGGSLLDQYVPPIDGSGDDSGFGGLTLVTVQDNVCTQNGGTTVTLIANTDGGTGAPPLQRLIPVGTTRAAGGLDLEGFVTFGADGSNVSGVVTLGNNGLFDMASEGNTIGVAATQGTNVLYQRYSAAGTADAGSLQVVAAALDSVPRGLAIGSGDGQSLVIWAVDGALHGVPIDANGNPGQKFDFAAGAYQTDIQIVTAYAGSGTWGVAWSGDAVSGSTSAYFALVTATGITGSPTGITTAGYTFQVVRLVNTPAGYGLLLTTSKGIGSDSRDDVYLAVLNQTGQPSGPVHRYLGADVAWDLAAQGSEMGIMSSRVLDNDLADAGLTTSDAFPADVQPYLMQFLPVDDTGAPLSGWVCVGAQHPSLDAYQDLAITADGTGYAVISRTPTYDDQLTRFNHLGK